MLKNNLIISLGDTTEIYQHLNQVANLSAKYPLEDFSLLAWKHHQSIVESCRFKFSQITYVDRALLKRSYNNHLINLSFSYNILWDFLGPLIKNKYFRVYTLSNNKESYLITSLLSSKEYIGSQFSPYRTIVHSNLFAHYINEVYPESPQAIGKQEVLSMMLDTNPQDLRQDFFLDTKGEDFQKFKNNFDHIKKRFSKVDAPKITVAIDLWQINALNNLAEVYYHLAQSEQFLPILLVQSGNAQHLALVKEVNEVMDNKGLAVEYDFSNLARSLCVFDMVINFGGPSKFLCNVLKKPQITILEDIQHLGHSGPSFKAGDFLWISSHAALEEAFLNDLLSIQSRGPLKKNLSIPSESQLWATLSDAHGTVGFVLRSTNAKVNSVYEKENFQNICFRNFFYEYFLNKSSSVEMFELVEAPFLRTLLESEYTAIENIYKHTLKCIRQVHEVKYSNETQANNFFKELDQLFNPISLNHLADLIRIIGRHQLDQKINQKQDSLDDIEKVLLDLKNHLLAGSNYIRHVFDALVKTHSQEKIGLQRGAVDEK